MAMIVRVLPTGETTLLTDTLSRGVTTDASWQREHRPTITVMLTQKALYCSAQRTSPSSYYSLILVMYSLKRHRLPQITDITHDFCCSNPLF